MEQKFTLENPMPPIWMMYPNIPQFSIGWRMGYGEGYRYEFYDWYETLSKEEQQQYDRMFPKPLFWRDFNEINEEDYSYGLIDFWEKDGIPKYSLDNLKPNKKTKYLYFWKPNDALIHHCLGQWQSSKFEVGVDEYFCTEQYMMAEKARVFEDEASKELIMKSRDPKKMKKLGQKVKNFQQDVWDKVKYSIVLNGNYYKFSQNKDMRDFLLGTNDKVLVEASPFDKIWGVGKKEEDISSPADWKGQNLLGFALMEVRDELQKGYKNFDIVNWKEIEKDE